MKKFWTKFDIWYVSKYLCFAVYSKKKIMRLKFCDATKKIIILGWWKNAIADSILSTSLFVQSVSPRSIFVGFIYTRS